METKRLKTESSVDIYLNAVRSDHFDVADLIIDNIDPNVVNKFGNSVFSYACRFHNLDAVKRLLLTGKVNINVTNSNGFTPIMLAAHSGLVDNVQYILENNDKVDINVVSDKLNTLLTLVCKKSFPTKVVKQILEYLGDCRLNWRNAYGMSALDYTIKRNDISTIKLLLRYGATGGGSQDERIQSILNVRASYLPKWNRLSTSKCFPKEFNEIAVHWILCCTRLKVFPKDIVYLILKYIGEAWKDGWGREAHIKDLVRQIEILNKN